MPQNWKTYKLGDFADVQNGYAFKSKDLKDSGIPVIKIKNIISPNVVLEGAGYYSGKLDDKLEKYVIKRNDFLISMTGSTVNVMSSAVGKMGTYRLDDIALLNQRVGKIYITDNDVADFDYVCYFLNRYEINYSLALNATGSANQANISPAQIRDLEILLPPLPEQKAIAQILSAIDDKIENNRAINKTLEEMAMALYKHWFVDFGPFQDGAFVESELGEIPEGWTTHEFLELFDLLSGGTPKTTEKDYWNGKFEWVSAKDIGNSGNIYINDTEKKITQLGLDNSSTKILPEDSVILVARGSVGKFGMIAKPMAMNQSCYGVYSKSKYSQATTYLLIDSLMRHFLNVAYGSVFDTITTSTFKNIKVLLPPNDVMEKIQKDINRFFINIKMNIQENQTLTQLRDTLLPKLISGEVRLKEFEEKIESAV
ncbi:restriction endonuclease subunit S [Aequorivita viscosa]|uniref:Type I restriction enzyme, S subunit n=1 Tax=Aequorivita viscosa TaxID=797419 RepID=A0A1M6M4F1_9FLAO|nr:restriction endonuclease subunit S [Aequorivita viscosa]SDX30616.1 type I restriction enzyme, S subunit [Aequorivita viscosa]SHJ78276.1 type I restriction enzyme, S subunit [Aequorivita viscosa]